MRFLVATILPTLLASSGFAKEKIDFSRDIRPILNVNCLGCHGGVKKESGVSFLYREQVLAKGKSGLPIVVPFKPDESEMIDRILSDDPEYVMPVPAHGPPLKKEEVALIRQWIEEGAEWNNHWSFEKPERHPAPEVTKKDWPKNSIDSFILAKMEEEELPPSPAASPGRLLRRIHIDLTGFPPSLEALDAFEKAYQDNPDSAVAAVVDDLLKKESFGEKWASQWLDVARYADSEGLGADRRWNAWPYRDWVIRALNADMPYDDFLIKQLAGDLLPNPTFDDLLATKFHRLTQQNQEGGTDNEEFRVMAVMDRVNTTWKGLQGITFECVQCHEHPYDPIRHDEYYKFLAFFNSSRDLDLASHHPVLRVPKDTKDYPKALEYRNRYVTSQTKLQDQSREMIKSTEWTKVSEMEIKSQRVKSKGVKSEGYLEFHTVGTIPRNIVFQLAIPKPDGLDQVSAIRFHTLPIDLEKARHSGTLGAVLSHIIVKATIPGEEKPVQVPLTRILGDDDFPYFDPNQSLKKGQAGWGAYTHQYHPRSCVAVLKEPLTLPEGSKLHIELHHNANAPTAPMATKRGRIDLTSSGVFHDWLKNDATKKLISERDKTRRAYHKIGRVKLATMNPLQPELARETRLFEKGNWLEKDETPLPAGTPASLHPIGSKEGQEPNRLDLAKWIASPENSFTSRMLVARVWEQLFGRSLVLTLEDFGSSGVPPSHPELLDDLAVRFQTEMGYSVKTLIREILNTATYRQSSKQSSIGAQKDPQNIYLSRGPRNRLKAEIVRDHHLAVGGLLTEKLYGEPVHPPIPNGVWKPFSKDPWNTAKVGDPNRYRRSLYTYWKRSIPHPSFDSFDTPTREVCSSRRLVSNTPLAALATLNDEAFAEMAGGLARRMKYQAEGDVRARLTIGYRLATSTRPSERALKILTDLFHRTEKDFEANPSQYVGLAGTPDGAAYTIVASTLLNMDDALTK